MPDDAYYLSRADVDVLRQIVAAYKRGDLGRPLQNARRALPERSGVLFGVVDSAVNGTSGALTDPPSGTLNVYKFTSTGGTTDSGYDETVYNLSTVSRTTDEFTIAVRDFESGKFCAVSGSGGTGYKKLCRFILDASLATGDASGTAKITNQYGDGTAHSTSGTITVGNMLTSATTAYLFSGSSGNAGLAYYSTGTTWQILQMQCPDE